MASEHIDYFAAIDKAASTKQAVIKAPFGWPGGKTRTLRWILDNIPESTGYVEVFGGSGVVLLNKGPVANEVYNDINSGVVSLYRVLRDSEKQQRLCEWLQDTVQAYEEFLHCRETWKDVHDDVERAGRWLYMVRYSFAYQGRSYGYVVKGKNSVGGKLIRIIPKLQVITDRLQNVNIENADWRTMLKKYDSPETVFYLDPPYPDTDMRACYGLNSMDWDEHRELLGEIQALDGGVVLSGYANKLYDSYTWDSRLTAKAFVSTGKTAAHKHYAEEVLWIKN